MRHETHVGVQLTVLRIGVLIATALGTLFWLDSIVQWWQIANTRRDGFELMGLALSTAFFVVLVMPTLILALTARWLPFGALASDTLWPWLPW